MKTLFDIDPVLPAGFNYSPGFKSEAEEMKLVKTTGEFDLQNMKFHEYEAKRKLISFGPSLKLYLATTKLRKFLTI